MFTTLFYRNLSKRQADYSANSAKIAESSAKFSSVSRSPRISAGNPQRRIASWMHSLEKSGRAAERELARVLRRSKRLPAHSGRKMPHHSRQPPAWAAGHTAARRMSPWALEEIFPWGPGRAAPPPYSIAKERKRTAVPGTRWGSQSLGHLPLDEHGERCKSRAPQ